MAEKARFWVGVLYPENMIDDWQNEIGDKVQVPYAYTVHDKCTDENGNPRKLHVHIILAFPNTTTYNHACSVFDTLSKDGKRAFNQIQRVINIRNKYEYIIHNTEDCRKKKKYLYDVSERITGNNFDIGSYEQLSTTDKNRMTKELCDTIVEYGFTNFADFYMFVMSNFDNEYFELLRTYSGLFERLTRGFYLKQQSENEDK